MELPVLFTDYTRNLLGDEDYMRLTAALESEQPVSIRLNPLKPFAFQLGEDEVPWCASGFYLKERLIVYFRSFVSCGLLLCAGSFVHVCGAGLEATLG